MQENDNFVTINEAVKEALSEWATENACDNEMRYLVDVSVQKAIAEWEETPNHELPVKVSAADAGTISGAVLVAMAEWHSEGTSFEEMVGLAEDHAHIAIDDWEHRRKVRSIS